MKLHIFNPEHDTALAVNQRCFILSHNVAKMKHELSFLPALWAEKGDVILSEDKSYAEKAYKKLTGKEPKHIKFITSNEISAHNIDSIDCWGIDISIEHYLKQYGIPGRLLHTKTELDTIRNLSHRKHVSSLLEYFKDSNIKDYICGECFEIQTIDELERIKDKFTQIVIKSPWSSSGRGVKYSLDKLSEEQKNWCAKIIKQQGSIIVEPYWEKLRDFAMEFISTKDGVKFCGLSIFETSQTSYSGSLIATEEEKENILTRYISKSTLHTIQTTLETFLTGFLQNSYNGVLGVDMMIVKDKNAEKFLINPCVEINLRRTMGHVALSLPSDPNTPNQIMTIDFDDNFHVKIKQCYNSDNNIYKDNTLI